MSPVHRGSTVDHRCSNAIEFELIAEWDKDLRAVEHIPTSFHRESSGRRGEGARHPHCSTGEKTDRSLDISWEERKRERTLASSSSSSSLISSMS